MLRHGLRTYSETDQLTTFQKDYNFIAKSIKARSAVIKSFMQTEYKQGGQIFGEM